MPSLVNSAGHWLLDAVLPQTCALCGLPSGRALPLCPPCAAELPTNDEACMRCAVPLPALGPGRVCGACQKHPPPFDRVRAPWLYGEYLGYLIHRWKYAGDLTLTPLLAELWLEKSGPLARVDALVPVPMHWWRQWRRGYNQSALLAQHPARRLPGQDTPRVVERLVRRKRSTKPQSGMGAHARARNLKDAFTALGPCDNLRLAVIDDVFTTGATAAEVARTLKRAGAAEVEVWCIARTPKASG